MSWREFEMLVGEGFRPRRDQVAETGGSADLVLTKSAEKCLMRGKQWRAVKLDVGVERELYGVMVARGAPGGFMVTSGRFTDAAAGFASGRNVKLIDGPRLHELLDRCMRPTAVRQCRRDPSTRFRLPCRQIRRPSARFAQRPCQAHGQA